MKNTQQDVLSFLYLKTALSGKNLLGHTKDESHFDIRKSEYIRKQGPTLQFERKVMQIIRSNRDLHQEVVNLIINADATRSFPMASIADIANDKIPSFSNDLLDIHFPTDKWFTNMEDALVSMATNSDSSSDSDSSSAQ